MTWRLLNLRNTVNIIWTRQNENSSRLIMLNIMQASEHLQSCADEWNTLYSEYYFWSHMNCAETKARACDKLHTWSNIHDHCGSMCSEHRDESNVALTITRILTARAQRCSRFPLRRSSSLWNTGPLPIIPPSVSVSLFLTDRTDDKGDVGSPFCARAWGQMLRARKFGSVWLSYIHGPNEAPSAYSWPTWAEPEPSEASEPQL